MSSLAGLLVLAVVAGSSFSPARLQEGSLPDRAPQASGGGEVLLELVIREDGLVADVVPLRTTAVLAAALRDDLFRWRFEPAREGRKAIASRVLVVGVFHPTMLLGATAGEPPREVEHTSPEVPDPTRIETPGYPPRAVGDAMLLVEAAVGSNGRVHDARVVSGGPPFSSWALRSVRRWRFRPAFRWARAVPAAVYVVCAFRSPVAGPAPPP
jgi:outer membrane biosynthesis protein TonB